MVAEQSLAFNKQRFVGRGTKVTRLASGSSGGCSNYCLVIHRQLAKSHGRGCCAGSVPIFVI
jgi:hypothetical protein